MVFESDRRQRRMADNRMNAGGPSASMDHCFSDRMKAPSSSQLVWISSEPSLDVVDELIRHFPEVVELSEEEI